MSITIKSLFGNTLSSAWGKPGGVPSQEALDQKYQQIQPRFLETQEEYLRHAREYKESFIRQAELQRFQGQSNIQDYLGAVAGGSAGINAGNRLYNQQPKEDIIEAAKRILQTPAYAMPLSQARDLWFARYGEEWVSASVLLNTGDDMDWTVIWQRLGKSGKMEETAINGQQYHRLES